MTLDQTIQAAFPLVAAPVGASLPWSEHAGVRFIAAANGLFREVVLPWIRLRHRIAPATLKTPYGALDEVVQPICGPVPKAQFARFIEQAKEALPNEAAGALIWNRVSGQWRYQAREAISASSEHIDYHEVSLGDEESLVVDVHSHGALPAFFSNEDDRDDAGAMRLSIVLGRVGVNAESLQSAVRLCMAGAFFPAGIGNDGEIEVQLNA